MNRYVDLSHTLYDGVANSSTYTDCPFHRYADGKDLSEVALDRFADLPAVVVRAPHGDQLTPVIMPAE